MFHYIIIKGHIVKVTHAICKHPPRECIANTPSACTHEELVFVHDSLGIYLARCAHKNLICTCTLGIFYRTLARANTSVRLLVLSCGKSGPGAGLQWYMPCLTLAVPRESTSFLSSLLRRKKDVDTWEVPSEEGQWLLCRLPFPPSRWIHSCPCWCRECVQVALSRRKSRPFVCVHAHNAF